MQSLAGHIFGRYRLMETIGQGGMATVYRAFDTVNNRYVAIKVLSPAMAQNVQFSERFRREARVVMQLKHPHILPVFDVGEKDGYAYIVMPFIKSGSLADRLARSSLKPYEAGRLVAQITSALDYAHKKGVVHRDIKPPNIMLDEKGTAYLADFGLAHLLDTSNSLTGSAVIGTPAYISPEQSLGRKVDARSDQYSLGIVLFQLATGHVPFDGDTPIAVLVKHVNDALPRPRNINPNVPEAIERVIIKATAKNPDDRFENMADMNNAFQAALAHLYDPEKNPAPTIVIKPSSLEDVEDVEPPPPPQRRLVRLAGFAMLLLLLLLACPVVSTGVLNILEGASNPVSGSALSTEDLSSDELTALAATIEALSTEAAATAEIRTMVQTVVVTSTVLSTPFELTTPTPTGELLWTPTVEGTERSPTATRIAQPTSQPTPAPTSTRRPPQPTPEPTRTKKPKTKTPPPPPTNTPRPPTNTPPPPPTNPPPTNPPPTAAPTVPPYP